MRTSTMHGDGRSRPIAPEHFIWLLGSLCRLHHLPFDAGLVQQQFPPPYDLAHFKQAAKTCGLKVGELALHPGHALEALPLPAIAL